MQPYGMVTFLLTPHSRFEEALRLINPRLSLPYWDSTLDNDMENPVNSIIWTVPFLGNGDGFVTSGAFANWQTPVGPLTRNIGGGSSLFSKENIRRILTRCRTREISDPTAQPSFNLEIFHGGPHNWVGGLMSGLNTAAHDPVFFLHHAFVDYVWEMFRIRQARFCRVNPSTDYPMTMGLHAAERPMDGLPPYRNIDGYMSYWTRFWYRYESAPRCSRFRPFCGTPYLRCDIRRRRCISVARRVGSEGQEARGVGFSAVRTANSQNALRARAQAASIDVGPKFRAPPPEPRTQDGQRLFRGIRRRFRRSARHHRASNPTANRRKVNNNPRFRAPPSDGRTSDVIGRNIAKGFRGKDPVFEPSSYDQMRYLFSQPMPLLPPVSYPDQPVSRGMQQSATHSLDLNTQALVNNWIFVPVRIIHNQTSLDVSVLKNRPQTLDPHSCTGNRHGTTQIKVQSHGLSYDGSYTDYAFVNSTLPVDSTTVYIAVKSPANESTQAMVLGVFGCGQMCQTHCLVPDVTSREYRPCTGIITLTASESNEFRRTVGGTIDNPDQGRESVAQDSLGNVRVVLYCAPVNDSSTW